MDNQSRERLGSRLGFILLSVGCAGEKLNYVWILLQIVGIINSSAQKRLNSIAKNGCLGIKWQK